VAVSDISEIVDRVSKRVAEVRALDVSEIKPESRLISELGAESLDLVELMYLLEQEFKIRLSKDDMSLSAQLGIPEEEIHDKEVLTPKALELLRQRFPKAEEDLKDGITRRHLATLLTVEEVAQSVQRKL